MTIATDYAHAKAELTAAKIAMAEIDAKLAAGRAEWISGAGQGNSPSERADLEARRAYLNLSRLKLMAEVDRLKVLNNASRGKTLVSLLCEALEQRGLQHVIEEARAQLDNEEPLLP